MEAYKQEFIKFMVESDVLKFGSFTLKSGRQSPFFMNAGAYVTGYQLKKLGEYYAQAIHDNFGDDFDVLFGPAYKGIPLVVSAAPFIARMVETSLAEVDAGVVEAAQSMGASTCQIIRKVYLPEAKPSLVLGGAISIVTILGYTAIAGTVGAGGLGDIAVRYGHQRFITSVMWVTVVILIIMVQIVQSLFGWLSKKIDKRLDTGAGKLTAFDLLSRLAHTK